MDKNKLTEYSDKKMIKNRNKDKNTNEMRKNKIFKKMVLTK